MSGQEVSYEKTRIYFSPNVHKNQRKDIVQKSGFTETMALGKYLGVPLTGKTLKKAEFQYVIDQVRGKLTKWKGQQLAFAGRVTLAKSVIEALPLYPMMTMKIPKTCLREIHKLQRNFIWGDNESGRKYHAIGWNVITQPKEEGGLGLRQLDVMNEACLLKMGWKIKHQNEELWSKVLWGKYGRGENFRSPISKNSDSSLWKLLVHKWKKIDDYGTWHIGDGKTVRAWQDSWINEGCNIDELHLSIPLHIQHACVADLALNDETWNWEILMDWLPEEIIWRIHGIPPPCMDAGPDFRMGTGKYMEGYSVKNMYRKLVQLDDNTDEDIWKIVWKINATERVRLFVWRLYHDGLLTNSKKAHMGLGSSMCRRCGNVEEDSLHVLRDCPRASKLWRTAVLTNKSLLFFAGTFKIWTHLNIMNHMGRDSINEWQVFWATGCYYLWLWHNKEEHDDNFNRPVDEFGFIMQQIQEYNRAKVSHFVAMVPHLEEKRIRWEKPIGDWIKINVDGASNKKGFAGCGGIIRGADGEWLGGFSKNLGNCTIQEAEIWAIYEGLKFGVNMGFKKIIMESDAKQIIKDINRVRKTPASGNLFCKIRKFLCADVEIQLNHVFREINQCADLLAKHGIQQMPTFKLFQDCPSFIKDCFELDLIGFAHSRLVPV